MLDRVLPLPTPAAMADRASQRAALTPLHLGAAPSTLRWNSFAIPGLRNAWRRKESRQQNLGELQHLRAFRGRGVSESEGKKSQEEEKMYAAIQRRQLHGLPLSVTGTAPSGKFIFTV